MRTTAVSDDTIYQAQENIACMTHGHGKDITVTLNGQASDGIISGGASVTFTLTLPGLDTGGK
jgi:hypothetical protein